MVSIETVVMLGVIMGILFFIPTVGFVKPFRKVYGEAQIGTKIDWFINKTLFAKKEIKITSGELHPKIFDNIEVIKAFEKAASKSVSIKIIAGPRILIEKGKELVQENKPLLKLAKEGKIQLHITNNRLESHYSMIDSQHIYKEEIHEPGAEYRKYTIFENSFLETNKTEKEFDENFEKSLIYPSEMTQKLIKLEYAS